MNCWETGWSGDVVPGVMEVETVSSDLGRSGGIFEKNRANLRVRGVKILITIFRSISLLYTAHTPPYAAPKILQLNPRILGKFKTSVV